MKIYKNLHRDILKIMTMEAILGDDYKIEGQPWKFGIEENEKENNV